MNGPIQSRGSLHLLPAALAAWLLYLAVDFLTHAVIMAGWWRDTGQFWLRPEELFRRIPFGYASFALYCAVLVWLMTRLPGRGAGVVAGLRFGAIAGAVYGILVALAIYSVFRAPVSLLLVWPLFFTAASVAAGGGAASVLGSERPWRRLAAAFGIAIFVFVIGVALQNTLFPS
ncbi:MAG TPA: hypothetical protein VMM18_10930 [Gemmatimonadaceae bacterium]|nr:hypothetical protein [Gemmatimonadaceae bacterium]